MSFLLPRYDRASENRLYRSGYLIKSHVDMNQNAGCSIFGHNPSAVLAALEKLLAKKPPLRIPLAINANADALRDKLIALAPSSSASDQFEVVLGMRSGAEALDTALGLALTMTAASRKKDVPLMLIVLSGSFHGNATRAAFSASAVFRSHPHAPTLCEFDAIYLRPDADPDAIRAAFAKHDEGWASCLAVMFEPQQHFASFASPTAETLRALADAASTRGIPLIADEIWSGVHRTGPFLASCGGGGDGGGDTAAAPIKPSMIILGKGLSAGMCKHSAILIEQQALRKWRGAFQAEQMQQLKTPSMWLEAALSRAVPRPLEPCALACTVALACLNSTNPEAIAARSRALSEVFQRHGAASSSWLLTPRGHGYSYELELRVTSSIPSDIIRALVCGICWFYLIWWRGVLLLPRPLRSPSRFHAELTLDTTDEEIAQLFSSLRAASTLATILSLLFAPISYTLALHSKLRSNTSTTASGRPLQIQASLPPIHTDGFSERAIPPSPPAMMTATLPLGASLSVEMRHHSLLESSNNLPVYKRAHAEMVYSKDDDEELPYARTPETLYANEGVIDCCADRSMSILGHHHPVPTEALKRFILEERGHAMPFGLLMTKPDAQALCKAIETMASDSMCSADSSSMVASAAEPWWRSRLMISATDANEAAMRLCLVHWAKRNAHRSAPLPTPVILLLGSGHHGHSWLLAGLPTATVRIVCLSTCELDLNKAKHLGSRLDAEMRKHIHGDCCAIAALMLEPICGQTGTCLLQNDVANKRGDGGHADILRALCMDYGGVPIICDETRSGLMRCNGRSLLVSPSLGLKPDVATIGEALGGGSTSVAAVVFDRNVFGNLAFPSSATMVNDTLSSRVALSMLGHLRDMADEYGASAASFEARVRLAVEKGAGSRGKDVCAVSGRGFMLGLRFGESILKALAAAVAGVPPYLLLHVYLLREHGIRVRPTADALMFDMPAVASASSVTTVCNTIEILVHVLAHEAFEEVIDAW